MPKTLGETIREYREAQRPALSQAALADKMGVSRASVNMWEMSKATPGESRIRVLMRLLKADPTDFRPWLTIDAVETYPALRPDSDTKGVPLLRSKPAPM